MTVQPEPPGPVGTQILTIPNVLSMLRLALVPVFTYLLVQGEDGAAVLVLVVSGASDWLDGKLARRWGQITRLGQILDPVADRLYILATLLGFAWRELLPWWFVVAVLGRDLVLTLTLPVLSRHGSGPLPVHHLGKAATFNILSCFPFLLLGDRADAIGTAGLAVGWAFAWWGVTLYWWAAILYLRQVRGVVLAWRDRAAAP